MPTQSRIPSLTLKSGTYNVLLLIRSSQKDSESLVFLHPATKFHEEPVNAYRLGYLSDAFFAAGVLLFLSEYGRGDLLNKVANSHKFGSIYFGMLHISDGWNAYDRSLHPGF